MIWSAVTVSGQPESALEQRLDAIEKQVAGLRIELRDISDLILSAIKRLSHERRPERRRR